MNWAYFDISFALEHSKILHIPCLTFEEVNMWEILKR